MSIRIIHTADVHLDAAFAGLGSEKGGRKRRAIRNTFSRTTAAARDWPADVLVIAGDLFESERCEPDTIGFLKSEFKRLDPIPVVVAPGNHDPYKEKSPYWAVDWPSNVHIFGGQARGTLMLDKAELTVVGIAHTSTHMEGRLVDVAPPAPEDSSVSILVAHASLQGPGIAEKSADNVWLPFSAEELADLGYTYAALGHYHNRREISSAGRTIAAYPGAPEGLNASETGKRHYLKVEIDGARVSVTPVGVSEIDFLRFEVPCDDYSTREEFFEALKKLDVKGAGEVIARVTARGRVASGFSLVAEVPEEIQRRFFHLTVADETVPAYDWDEIAKEDSLRGEIARIFEARLNEAGDKEREALEVARLLAVDAIEGRAIALPPEVTRVD